MKKIVSSYSFDASERRVTLTGLAVPLERLLLIVNATRNLIIYNLTGTGHPTQPLGATVAQNSGNTVVTLAFDTTQFSDSDKLSIFYDDGTSGGNTIDGSSLTITGIESEVEIKNDEGNPVPIAVPDGSTLPVELHDGNGTPLSTQVISSSPGGAVTRALSVFRVGIGATYLTNASGTHAATVKEGGTASSPQDPFLVVGLNPTSNTVRLTDGGSSTPAIKPGNIAPTALDPSLVVGLSPNSNSVRNQDGSGNALTSAARGTERALSVQVVDASGNQVTTFGSSGGGAVTQSGTWSVRNQDGSGNALTSSTRGSERALSVQVVDASGTQVTSFNGGTVSQGGNWTVRTQDGSGNALTSMARGTERALSVQVVNGSGEQITSFGSQSASITREARVTLPTITGTPTNTQIAAINLSRKYLLIQNLDAVGTAYLSFNGGTPTSNSFQLLPRSSIVFEGSFIPTGQVNGGASTMNTAVFVLEA